jgi:glycine cleavage system H protein
MTMLRFTNEHEWIRVEGEVGTVGITDFAQQQLGDVVFVGLPEIGAHVERGDEAAVVESPKAASEVYAPVSGDVVAVNERLADEPNLVNADAFGNGWMFRVKIADAGQLDALMDRSAYDHYVKDLA